MKIFISIITLSLASFSSLAEIAVIAHPSNNETINNAQISKIFLGKAKTFPSGEPVIPVNQEHKNAIRSEFDKKVLKKSASQLKAYWSKLLFTGKGQPPKNVSSDLDVIKLVAQNPNIVGYIDADKVDDSVKIIAKF